CSFLIGHRRSIVTTRAIRRRIAEAYGAAFVVDGVAVHAFPAPRVLLDLDAIPGLDAERLARLHGVARAALDGDLDRDRLRSLPQEAALEQARRLRGVGEFFATGIVLRGAGLVDAVPDEAITKEGVRRLYGLDGLPDAAEMAAITDAWRPYRMWCSVLVHMAQRRHRSM